MPPFGTQGCEARRLHDCAQQFPIGKGLLGEQSLCEQRRFLVDVAPVSHVVHLCPHRECVDAAFLRAVSPCGIVPRVLADADVNRHSVIVHTTAVGRIAHVEAVIGALHFVPHRLLNAHRACGVKDDEAEVGTPALQLLLCSLQGLGTIGKQVCLTQIFVENFVAKVVGSCIHQSCFDSGVDVFDVHQSLLGHPLGRWRWK